jgi:hypothetical protein
MHVQQQRNREEGEEEERRKNIDELGDQLRSPNS